VTGVGPPSDAEWKEYIEGVASCDLETMRSIVIIDGGAMPEPDDRDGGGDGQGREQSLRAPAAANRPVAIRPEQVLEPLDGGIGRALLVEEIVTHAGARGGASFPGGD